MPDIPYYLTEDDVKTLRSLLASLRGTVRGRMLNYSPRQGASLLEGGAAEASYTPDVYIAWVPATGLPALGTGNLGTGTGTGSSSLLALGTECDIFRLDILTGDISSQHFQQKVYNLSFNAVPGSQFVPVMRDKWGAWLVVPGQQATSGGGGTLTVTDAAGHNFTSVSKLTGDANSVLTFSNPVAGQAVFSVADASDTAPGIVSTGSQNIPGTKYFNGDIIYMGTIASQQGAFGAFTVLFGDEVASAYISAGTSLAQLVAHSTNNDCTFEITAGSGGTTKLILDGNSGVTGTVLWGATVYGGIVTALGSSAAGGDLSGTYPNPTLKSVGPGAGTYTVGARLTPTGTDGTITLDAQGRVTAVTQAT